MKPEKVITCVESAIYKVGVDIRKKKGAVGSDKLNSLSKLINAYNRLLERSMALNQEPPLSYHDMLERGGVMKMKSAGKEG